MLEKAKIELKFVREIQNETKTNENVIETNIFLFNVYKKLKIDFDVNDINPKIVETAIINAKKIKPKTLKTQTLLKTALLLFAVRTQMIAGVKNVFQVVLANKQKEVIVINFLREVDSIEIPK